MSSISTPDATEFLHKRLEFWKEKLRKVHHTLKLTRNVGSVSFEDEFVNKIHIIFDEVRNLLLLDPKGDIMLPHLPNSSPLVSPGIVNLEQWRLRYHPLIPTFPTGFAGDVYFSAGLDPSELNIRTSKVDLFNIRASTLLQGAFKIRLTDDPSMHLRFEEKDRHATLLILDSKTMLRLMLLDLTGLMRSMPLI